MTHSSLQIGSAGFVGAVVAIFADLGLKGTASATNTIKLNLIQFLELDASQSGLVAISLILVLVAIGVASCFIFEAGKMHEALYRGASVLAVIVTAVPNPNEQSEAP